MVPTDPQDEDEQWGDEEEDESDVLESNQLAATHANNRCRLPRSNGRAFAFTAECACTANVPTSQ